MKTAAQEILIPTEPGIYRTVFLYVGQGESTLMIIPNGSEYLYMLIDCNIDKKPGEIDIVKLLKDLLGDRPLDYFVNTHPHTDHLEGIKEVYQNVGIKEVWHSGHEPKGKHKDIFSDLKYIIDQKAGNEVYKLLGSDKINKLDKEIHKVGDIDYQILSPAEYVADNIEEETPENHYKRIHEQSGVIKFSYGELPTSILITGDSDLCAWRNHITEHHKNNLHSDILSASHHGSRTFFKDNEEDEPYTEHIENIIPHYIIISSPPQAESEHGHPHDDAIEIYKEFMLVEDDLGSNIFHLGDGKYSLIVDIYPDGTPDLLKDFDLKEEYGFKDSEKNETNKIKSFYPRTRIESDKEMGS